MTPIRILLLAAVIFAPRLPGEIAGTPVPPIPDAMPFAWLAYGNDDIGVEGTDSEDDHRTSAFTLASRLGGRFIAVADHAIFTDRRRRTRSDELTVTVGMLPFGDGRSGAPWLSLGVGARLNGDLLGGSLQNDYHQDHNYISFDFPYDEHTQSAVAYASGAAPWWPLPWGGGVLGMDLLASTYGELQGEARAYGALRAGGGVVWAGPRCRLDDGVAQGATARAVARFERGAWIDIGIAWRWLTFSVTIDPGNGNSFGRFALVVE